MFCPNCGNKVQDESNFCPNCGKNLKNVKITVTEKPSSKTDFNKKSSSSENSVNTNQETQVFKPLKSLDGIDSTNEISDIIKAVDEKISENINNYETSSYSKADLKIEESKSKEKVSEKQKSKEKFKKNTDQTDLPVSEAKDDNAEKNDKKFSIRKMWKDFINEDDDEFSIFSSIDEQEETDDDKIELVASSTNSDTQTNLSTDTAGIPIAAIEEKLKELDLEESSAEKDKKKPSSEKDTSDENKHKEIPKEKEKNNTSKSKSGKKHNKPETKLKEPEEKLSHKSFTDQVNEELRKLEEQQKNENKETDSIDTDSEKEKKQLFKSLKKNKDSEVSKSSDSESRFMKLMDFIVEKLKKIDSFVIDKGKNGIIILSVIGVLLSLIPIIIGSRRLSFFIAVLLIFKLLFSIAEFYIPLNIATDKVWVESSDDEVKYFAFINWFICQIFLFISFIFSPWDGFFTFKLLPALTPLPIATVLLFAIAILISLGQYWSQLKDANKINFIAWYMIPFVLIHFLSKLIFVVLNFIS